MKKVLRCLAIMAVALLAAVNYEMFVFPNQFAPSGLNGMATMIQYLLHVNVGYITLLINVPLAVLVFFKVDRKMALYSMLYVVTFSLLLLVFARYSVFKDLAYETDNGTSLILGPLAAGIINGFCYSCMIRWGANTGGMDFIAALIHKKHPDKDLMWIIFSLNVMVAAVSYFVYHFKIEPVLLCIIYCYLTSAVGDRVLKTGKSAVKFEIITHAPAALSQEILYKLGHGVTVLDGRGMYSGKDTKVLLCVINRNQVPELEAIIRRYPGTFAYLAGVSEVMGNFKHVKKRHEIPEAKP